MARSPSIMWASSLSKDKHPQPPRPKQEPSVQSRVSAGQSHENSAEGDRDGAREWDGRERGSHEKQQTDRPPHLSGQGNLNPKPGSNFRDFFLKQVCEKKVRARLSARESESETETDTMRMCVACARACSGVCFFLEEALLAIIAPIPACVCVCVCVCMCALVCSCACLPGDVLYRRLWLHCTRTHGHTDTQTQAL
jgi:hypothetical protein